MKYLSKNNEETLEVAKKFLAKISKNKKTKATVVGLSGDLGSSKTTFTQNLAKVLGVTETVTSPTFVLEKIYLLNGKKKFKKLIHIDAYRLESGKELLSLGFVEIAKDPKNLILVEWPERVMDILSKDLVKIKFNFIDEFKREIIF